MKKCAIVLATSLPLVHLLLFLLLLFQPLAQNVAPWRDHVSLGERGETSDEGGGRGDGIGVGDGCR